MPIVGVPLVKGAWQVDWLTGVGGWLQGTAFPGPERQQRDHEPRGHATTAPDGPFARLNTLAVGDKIFITAFDRQYIYEVQVGGQRGAGRHHRSSSTRTSRC